MYMCRGQAPRDADEHKVQQVEELRGLRGSHLSNTTSLTHVFLKPDE